MKAKMVTMNTTSEDLGNKSTSNYSNKRFKVCIQIEVRSETITVIVWN